MSKKFLIILILISFIYLAVPALTQASMSDALDKTASQADISQNQNLTSLTVTLIQGLLGILGLVFVILLIYGGVTWMTSMGQEEKIKKARSTIRNSVIGLLIIMLSYAIVFYVLYLLDQADVIYYY
jgi:Trk-type K+ transport system membrane component